MKLQLLNALFALIFMAGCGEEGEIMLMSKPVEVTRLDTSVSDTTPDYDENATYADGALVKKDGGIYRVGVIEDISSTTTLPGAFNNKITYLEGGLTTFNGSTYQADMNLYIHPDDSNTDIKRSPVAPNLYDLPTIYLIYGSWEAKVHEYRTSIPNPQLSVRYTFTLTDEATSTYDVTEDYVTDNGDGTETITSTSTTSHVVHLEWSVDLVDGDLFVYGATLYEVAATEIKLANPDVGVPAFGGGYWYPFTLVGESALDSLVTTLTYNLVYLWPILEDIPFDAKQYSVVGINGQQTWTIKALSMFDTLAIGHLRGDTVTVVFKDSTGTEITRHDNEVIDGRIDVDGRLPHTYTTMILYSDTDIDVNGTIEITIDGAYTEVGMFKAGLSIDMGFTNLEFKNNGKDNSPKREDEFSGFIDYVEGIKVMVHKGSIDMPIERYDITSRFIRDFLGSLMIINGSDAKNTPPDSKGIFSATQLIARIKSMDMGTKVKDGDIEPMIPISFVCEEIV